MQPVHVAAPAGKQSGRLLMAPSDGAYIDLPPAKKAADVRISFGEADADASQSNPQCAFWVQDASTPSKHGPLNVLAQAPKEDYFLRGIPEGDHEVHVVLWLPPAHDANMKPSKPEELLAANGSSTFRVVQHAQAQFHVKRFEDFKPTYEWQQVLPWHRIPPGLEVTMDMEAGGQGGGNKARIPQPWQWEAKIHDDLTAAGGAPRVQRTAVQASTTMGELLQQLGLGAGLFDIVWQQEGGSHTQILQPNWTAQQADLFRYANNITVRRHVE